MKSRKNVQDKLFVPLKENNNKLECMFDNRAKMKSYRSEDSLNDYSPDCDKIAIYKLVKIITKENKEKN